MLDAGAVVGDTGAEAHRGFHHLHRDWALEETRYSYVQFLSTHCFFVFLSKVWRERTGREAVGNLNLREGGWVKAQRSVNVTSFLNF